ncbi:MAG: hypothetical protein VX335_04105, partial [Pseudomonadota bacterium]|nr:hypothetical protein [Pseudomonadota bacterium]
ELIKIILTDPVWLQRFSSQKESCFDLLNKQLTNNVQKKAAEVMKTNFAKTLNSSLNAICNDLISNYDLDNVGEAGVQGLVDIVIKKNKDGQRDLGPNYWGCALSGWGSNLFWVRDMLPRNGGEKGVGRNIDGLFASLYAALFIFGRDSDNMKKVFLSGYNKANAISKNKVVKEKEKTVLSYLDQNAEFSSQLGLVTDNDEKANVIKAQHGHYFDDTVFAALYADLDSPKKNLKGLYGSFTQYNLSRAIELINNVGSSARASVAFKNQGLFDIVYNKLDLENPVILKEMLDFARHRANILRDESKKYNGKELFGYDLNDTESLKVKKEAWVKVDSCFTDDIREKHYKGRKLFNPFMSGELSSQIETKIATANQLKEQLLPNKKTISLFSFSQTKEINLKLLEALESDIDVEISAINYELKKLDDKLAMKALSMIIGARGKRQSLPDAKRSLELTKENIINLKSLTNDVYSLKDKLALQDDNKEILNQSSEQQNLINQNNDTNTTKIYKWRMVVLTGCVILGLAAYSFVIGAALLATIKYGLVGVLLLAIAAYYTPSLEKPETPIVITSVTDSGNFSPLGSSQVIDKNLYQPSNILDKNDEDLESSTQISNIEKGLLLQSKNTEIRVIK